MTKVWATFGQRSRKEEEITYVVCDGLWIGTF